MSTLKMGLTDLSDSDLVTKGRTCYDMCKGNEHFLFPDGLLDRLKEACDTLANLQDHVVFYGGILAHQQKREAAAALAAQIRTLAGFVSAQSNGDDGKILSAGFELRRKASPVDQLEPVLNLRPVLTNFSGEVLIRWQRVPHATNYQVFANATDPNDPAAWQPVAYTSSSRCTVEALESGKFYWFRVQALGRKGLLSPQSQVVKALAA